MLLFLCWICIWIGICLCIFWMWEIIVILCFWVCRLFRVFIVSCRDFGLRLLKFLLMNSDLMCSLFDVIEVRLSVRVREIRKVLLLESEYIECSLLFILVFIISRFSLLLLCCRW